MALATARRMRMRRERATAPKMAPQDLTPPPRQLSKLTQAAAAQPFCQERKQG